MKQLNINTIIKIIIAMIISLSIVTLLPSNPRSTGLFLARLKNNFLALFSQKKSYTNLVNTPLSAMKQISKGVYAKEDTELGTVYIKVGKDVQWDEKIIQVNGHKILLRSIK